MDSSSDQVTYRTGSSVIADCVESTSHHKPRSYCISEQGLLLKKVPGHKRMTFALAQGENLDTCLKEAEEKAKVLSEQLAVSEETKTRLLEQVSWLEEKIEAMECKEAGGESYEKMLLMKDKSIEKLQGEVKASKEQLVALKLEHERKVKKLQNDLATAKQETTTAILEFNKQIKMLCEGNPAPRGTASLEEHCGTVPSAEGDRKGSLIVALSVQLSLQTERITQLEEVLEEKERKIQKLEAEQSSHLSPKVEGSATCF
ncbi:coiled-coil domain-containing protein 192 [Ctenodactylus gundi]